MDWNKKYLYIFTVKSFIGLILGAIAGFMYYYFVGCQTGSCPIKSNPWLMTLWGGAMGYLLADLIIVKKNSGQNNSQE